MPLKAILILILLSILVILGAANIEFVDVWYYDFTFTLQKVNLPLCVVMLVPLILGLALGWLMGWIPKLKMKGAIRKSEKTIHSLTDEIERLKKPSLPEYKKPGN